MGDWLTGMVQGFTARHREVEDRNYAEGLRSRQREGAVLQTLANSPDPEVRTLAITGMLDAASPARKAKGLRGWMGEVAQSPYLAAIRNLSPMVHETKTVPDVPTQQGYIPDAPHEVPPGPGALPQGSPIQMGADGAPTSPLRPLSGETVEVQGRGIPTTPMVSDMRTQIGQVPPSTVQLSYDRPRQFLPSAADLAREQARAKAEGDIEGDVAGWQAVGGDPAEFRAATLAKMRGRLAGGAGASPYQAIAGETQVNGQWVPTYATFDKATGGWKDQAGAPLASFRPKQTTIDLGDMKEALAINMFGKRAAQLAPEEMGAVLRAEQQWTQDQGLNRALGVGLGRAAAPMTPQQAQQAGVPGNTTPNQIAGQAIPTVANRETRRTLGAVEAEIREQIIPLLKVLPSQREFGGTFAPGAILAARRRNDPAVQTAVAKLESSLNAIKTTLGRARGDTRLSDADIRRIDAALASVDGFSFTNLTGGDSQETARARIDETLTHLGIVLQSLPQDPIPTAVGAPPPGPTTPGLGRTAATAARPGGPRSVGAPPPGGGSPLDQPAVGANGQGFYKDESGRVFIR